jgi:hypothetical protein
MYGKTGVTEMEAHKQRRCRLVHICLFLKPRDMQVRAVGIIMFLIFVYSSGFQPASCGPLESDCVI